MRNVFMCCMGWNDGMKTFEDAIYSYIGLIYIDGIYKLGFGLVVESWGIAVSVKYPWDGACAA